MSITIAIAGKGGVGKSTIAALLIKWLNYKGIKSILAVDADSNTNLNNLLGVEVDASIGAIREELKEKVDNIPGGMNKQQFLEYKIHQALVETPDFDLISMGRPEGPGCYCYSNNLLRDLLKTLSDQYQYVVVDNEAGMEHLSRRTLQSIDYLFIVSDASVRGVQTAGRLNNLLRELDTRVKNRFLIINRCKNGLTEELKTEVENVNLPLAAAIEETDKVRNFDSKGIPIYKIDNDSNLFKTIDNLFEKLIKINKPN